MAREVAGFTLIEILVGIAIIGILTGIAVPSYTHWQMERQLTSDTEKVYSFVQKERARAYSTQQELTLTIDGSSTICDDYGNCIQTENAFSATDTNLSIFGRGVYEDGHIRLADTSKISSYEPTYSCVVMTRTRARLGRYDSSSGSCEPQ